MPLLLLLAGCLQGSYYPSHGASQTFPIGDTGGGGVTYGTTPTLPCNRPDEGTTAQLTVQNPSGVDYQLSWMNDQCQEMYQVMIPAGSAWNTTVGNHVIWVVRDRNSTFIRWFGIPSGSNVSWVEVLP